MAIRIEQEEQIEVKRHTITLDEYDAMCVAGVFDEDARIELIRGELVDMPPPGPEHDTSVRYLHRVFYKQVGDQAVISPQGNTIRLPDSASRPQPDLAILRLRDDDYRGVFPEAEDVILIVEVAQSSLAYDRGTKLALYAEAAIPEYWVVDVAKGLIEAYAEPAEGNYQSMRMIRRGEILQLPDGLEGSIAVDDILGSS
jgi:Uma2 family endonuclease